MPEQVQQWPWTGSGSVDLLRMASQAGVEVRKPKRVAGADLRELVLRGVVRLGPERGHGPGGWRLQGAAVGPHDHLPYGMRWAAARLALVDPGPLHAMWRKSWSETVIRRSRGLPEESFATRTRRNVKEEFTAPKGGMPAPPSPEDEARSLMGRGLVVWGETRFLKIIKTKERMRTALGDEWARRGEELLTELDRLPALVTADPQHAAGLAQSAGAFVCVLPGMFAPIAAIAAAVPVAHRPVPVGPELPIDVLGSVEAIVRDVYGDGPPRDLPDLFDLVGKATEVNDSSGSA